MPVAYRDARSARAQGTPGRTRGATLVLRKRGLLAGLAAALLGMSAGPPQVVAALGTTRTISLYHIHTEETITVTYRKDGKYVPDALKKLNWFLRDWRQNKEIEMDPKVIDLLWEMHTELGSKEPIHIICGYRSEKTNNMLRRTVGGQAKRSYHIRGKAIDAAFPDIPVKQMRYSALVRERGGVGYYPTSGIPFVHVDSGPVRAWPRLPRYELALLFPNGHTLHKPSGGGDITPRDVLKARAGHKELAAQVAKYFDLRNQPKKPFAVAEANPSTTAPDPAKDKALRVASLVPAVSPPVAEAPPPKLKSAPRLLRTSATPSQAERDRLNTLVKLASLTAPAVSYRRPPETDRAKLEHLITASVDAATAAPSPDVPSPDRAGAAPSVSQAAASAPGPLPGKNRDREATTRIAAILPEKLGAPPAAANDSNDWNTGWAPAPQFDADHPEELSYRPFPIAPFLTQSASADDNALVKLIPLDVTRTLDLLEDGQVILPLRLRPGGQVAEVMWAQQFRGDAVDISVLEEAEQTPSAPSGLASRTVRTTAR